MIYIVFFSGFSGIMDVFEWLDDESIEKLKEDREPYEAPSTHYTPKPNNLGKLIWLSGKYAIPVFYSNKIFLLLRKNLLLCVNVYNLFSLLPISYIHYLSTWVREIFF